MRIQPDRYHHFLPSGVLRNDSALSGYRWGVERKVGCSIGRGNRL
jgi:hypothetical protein